MDDGDEAEPYTVTFEERPGYLYAHIKAETMTLEIALAYLGEIAVKARQVKARRVMIDRDVPVVLSASDAFLSMKDFVDRVKGRKVALVNRRISHEESIRFSMMVAKNRGAFFEVHNNIPDAERWLLE